MIEINFDDGKLYCTCKGNKKDKNKFFEEVESCKYLGMQYDAKKKAWISSVGKKDKIFSEFEQHGIDIDEWTKKEINNYFSNIKELQKIIKRSEYTKFDENILKYKPLHDFQFIDITKSLNQNRFGWFWATGLGKSYALAGNLQHYRNIGQVHRAIILTSTIGILNLSYELEKFLPNYDKSKTLVIDSITNLKNRLIFDEDWDIIISGYDSFRSVCDSYDKIINNRKNKVKYRTSSVPLDKWFGNYKGIIYLDECHLIGNPNSLRSKAISMNLKHFYYRYLSSATPCDKEERFYTLLKILDADLVNGLNYFDWLSEYCTLGNRWSRFGINKDTWNHQKWAELQDKLYRTYAVKREKKLLNLPTAYDVPLIKLDMSQKHREIYEAFTYEVINEIKNRNSKNNLGVLENLKNTFSYLQLAIDNPLCLLNTPKFNEFDPKLQAKIKNFNFGKDFTKLEAMDNVIQEECIENNNKIIIAYYHPLTLQELQKYIKTGFDVLSAETPKEDRLKIIENFKKNSNKMLLASINIANSSFTLTEAKAILFLERVWAYITYEQFRGRIYRIGQEDEVRYYNFCYNNSIDYLQLEALKTKGQVVDNLVKKNVLSPEEWKLLFNCGEENIKRLI